MRNALKIYEKDGEIDVSITKEIKKIDYRKKQCDCEIRKYESGFIKSFINFVGYK